MISLALVALMLGTPDSEQCPPPWSEIWHVRLLYEAAPGVWSSTGTEWYATRGEAVAKRQEIIAHGWPWPPIMPGPQDPELRGETRVAPGALRFASVKRACCRLDLPPQERPDCTWPDGDPPPAPLKGPEVPPSPAH